MSEKSSEKIIVTVSIEAARMLRTIVPPSENNNIKSRIARAARRLGWSISRAKDIWYGDARVRLRAHEMDALRAAANESKSNVANHAAQIEAAARALEAASPSLHRVEIDRLRDAARRLRNLNDGALTHD